MKAKILRIGLLCGLVAFTSQTVRAETKAGLEAENSLVQTEKSLFDRVSETATLSYFGVYRGASLEDLSNSLQSGPDGKPDNSRPQAIESSVTAGYKMNTDLMLGAVGHFNYFPIGNPVGTGQDLQLLDPSIVVTRNNIIKAGEFSLSGKFYLTFPLTDADTLKKNHLALASTAMLIANYEVPNTRLTVGWVGYLRNYVLGPDAPNPSMTYYLYGAPNATYQFSSNLAGTLWVDLVQALRRSGSGMISGLNNDTADIEPGVNWDITKNISLNPILNIYPSHPTLSATSLQANIVAKAF